MVRVFGLDKLVEQFLMFVAEAVDCEMKTIGAFVDTGDSEIERLFFLALHVRTNLLKRHDFHGVEYPKDAKEEARLLESDEIELLVRSQAQIGEYRVDFLIHSNVGHHGWQRLVVECDGHDYHERTKEQAARDRSRDRWLTANGYQVFRFTGSEIWRDPFGCADQVANWALKARRP